MFRAVLDNLAYFASEQVRNVGGLAGNVFTACSVSDLNSVFQAADCAINVVSKQGSRTVTFDEFFIAFRKVDLKPDEIILSIDIPFTTELEYIEAYKQSRRKDDDLSIVCSGMYVRLEPSDSGYNVANARFSFGGVAPVTVLALKSAELAKGKKWNRHLVDTVNDALSSELTIPLNVPGGLPEYRRALITSLFFKFFLTVSARIDVKSVDADELDAVAPLPRPVTRSAQVFEAPLINKGDGVDPNGLPLAHMSALEQVRFLSGKSYYLPLYDLNSFTIDHWRGYLHRRHAEIRLRATRGSSIQHQGPC